MLKIKEWFEDHWEVIGEAFAGFCIGTAVTYWLSVLVGAIKGLKLIWVPRR